MPFVKKRKTPIEHTVHTHTRKTGRRVDKYQRGEDVEPILETPNIFSKKNDPKSHGGFDIRLKYADGSSKSGVVSSADYRTALPKAIKLAEKQVRSVTLRKMEPWTREVK
jgi:hypothetical protein